MDNVRFTQTGRNVHQGKDVQRLRRLVYTKKLAESTELYNKLKEDAPQPDRVVLAMMRVCHRCHKVGLKTNEKKRMAADSIMFCCISSAVSLGYSRKFLKVRFLGSLHA